MEVNRIGIVKDQSSLTASLSHCELVLRVEDFELHPQDRITHAFFRSLYVCLSLSLSHSFCLSLFLFLSLHLSRSHKLLVIREGGEIDLTPARPHTRQESRRNSSMLEPPNSNQGCFASAVVKGFQEVWRRRKEASSIHKHNYQGCPLALQPKRGVAIRPQVFLGEIRDHIG